MVAGAKAPTSPRDERTGAAASDAKPRVAFITRKWPPAIGGMEIYSRELVAELRKATTLDLYALPGRNDGRRPSLFALLAFAISTTFRLLARRGRYQVVHGGDLSVWPLVFLTVLGKGDARPVLSAHGMDIALSNCRGLLPAAYAAYLALGARLLPSAVVLANSRATARLCRQRGLTNVRVVPLATRVPRATRGAPEPYVLFVGRLTRHKGCAWFIREVLPLLKPDLRLVVVGTVWDRNELQALDCPRVEFRGSASGADLDRTRRLATAVIVPNLGIGPEGFEGFGLTALEGAAAEGIVLASNVHGIRDAVRDAKTGFLLPAGEPQAWRAKIESICRWTAEQRQAFIDRSRAIVERDYCWARVAKDTLAAYRNEVTEPVPTFPQANA